MREMKAKNNISFVILILFGVLFGMMVFTSASAHEVRPIQHKTSIQTSASFEVDGLKACSHEASTEDAVVDYTDTKLALRK